MTFRSVLNPLRDGNSAAEMSEAPAYFADLNLDQIVASITADKQEYNLAPFFYGRSSPAKPSSTARR